MIIKKIVKSCISIKYCCILIKYIDCLVKKEVLGLFVKFKGLKGVKKWRFLSKREIICSWEYVNVDLVFVNINLVLFVNN